MIESKRLTYLGTFGSMDFYRFNPRLFSYYLKGYQKINLRSFIRMTVTLILEGYNAYYMCSDEEIIGCAVITPGGGRMKCADKKDIVIGPYWIEQKYRGKGYANSLIYSVLHDLGLKYRCAYAFVQKTNLPSIKTLEHNSFVNIGEAGIEKYTHRWILSDGGEGYIFKAAFGNEEE